MKRKNLLNKKGFTLIELIVVIAILAILALILVPSITGYISEANEARDKANARTVYTQLALDNATTTGGITVENDQAVGNCNIVATGTTFETITGIKCGDSTVNVTDLVLSN